MSGNNEILNVKWSTIKEQLIALCALSELSEGYDDLKKLLNEDIELKQLNSQKLHAFLYHILGIIDLEERDKLIQWPLVNIKTNTKFRKGVSSMIYGFQEKYPWARVKKLPESYFINPHGYQSRVVDFILRLSNLAIHVSLNNSELLHMHSGEGLNPREIAIMTDVISKARKEEERRIRNNILPLEEIEEAINATCGKCIAFKQGNNDLQQQLNNLKKHAVSEQLFPSGKNPDIDDLKKIRDEKLSELNSINEELFNYFDLSKKLLKKIKAFRNPPSLGANDFGCENSSPDLASATSKVCGNLCEFFQYITMKKSTKEQEDNFYEKLSSLKKIMIEYNEALQSFLCSVSVRHLTN